VVFFVVVGVVVVVCEGVVVVVVGLGVVVVVVGAGVVVVVVGDGVVVVVVVWVGSSSVANPPKAPEKLNTITAINIHKRLLLKNYFS